MLGASMLSLPARLILLVLDLFRIPETALQTLDGLY